MSIQLFLECCHGFGREIFPPARNIEWKCLESDFVPFCDGTVRWYSLILEGMFMWFGYLPLLENLEIPTYEKIQTIEVEFILFPVMRGSEGQKDLI